MLFTASNIFHSKPHTRHCKLSNIPNKPQNLNSSRKKSARQQPPSLLKVISLDQSVTSDRSTYKKKEEFHANIQHARYYCGFWFPNQFYHRLIDSRPRRDAQPLSLSIGHNYPTSHTYACIRIFPYNNRRRGSREFFI